MLSKQQKREFVKDGYLVIPSTAPLAMTEKALQVVVRVKEYLRFSLPLGEEGKGMGGASE